MSAPATGTGNGELGTGGRTPHAASSSDSRFPIPDSRHPGTLAARDFSFWYGAKQALFDVNLTARLIARLFAPKTAAR